jgi:diguanylate cyclase
MPKRNSHGQQAQAAQQLQQLQVQVRAVRRTLHGLNSELVALRQQRDLRQASLAECAALAQTAPQGQAHLLRSAFNAQASALAAVSRLDQLAVAMQRDPLTNTANRARLLERLQSAIVQAGLCGGSTALVFLDVDHFKHINDTLGHATGDAVLQIVARRLQTAVRDSDAVGRHGGDEFLVLLAAVTRDADAALVVKKIIADIAAPSLVCGHLLQVSVSAGIALYPADASDAQSLIRLADAAMYRSKRLGGGRFSFHADGPRTPA